MLYHLPSNQKIAIHDPFIILFFAHSYLDQNTGNATKTAQTAKFMGPTWGPPGSCRPQMGPMLALWTLLSGCYQYLVSLMVFVVDQSVVTLRQRQNGRHFTDDTFKCIFLDENIRISIKISLKFVPKGPINNIPTLVQIMAWRRPGDKPLSEPMMVRSLTHICVTRPQWVKAFSRMKMHEFLLKFLWSLFLRTQLTIFQHWLRWCIWKYRLRNGHFVQGEIS